MKSTEAKIMASRGIFYSKGEKATAQQSQHGKTDQLKNADIF